MEYDHAGTDHAGYGPNRSAQSGKVMRLRPHVVSSILLLEYLYSVFYTFRPLRSCWCFKNICILIPLNVPMNLYVWCRFCLSIMTTSKDRCFVRWNRRGRIQCACKITTSLKKRMRTRKLFGLTSSVSLYLFGTSAGHVLSLVLR